MSTNHPMGWPSYYTPGFATIAYNFHLQEGGRDIIPVLDKYIGFIISIE